MDLDGDGHRDILSGSYSRMQQAMAGLFQVLYVNSDGKLDILVGDMTPLVSPANNVTDGEFKQKFADWDNSLGEAAKALNTLSNDPNKRNEAQERYQKVYNQRSEFMSEDRTGFVWIYLRK